MAKSVVNKILLLADMPSGAAELAEAERVIKALMHKFRKTVLFDFMPPIFISDYKNSDTAARVMLKELSEHKAVLWGRASVFSSLEHLYDFCEDNGVYAVERRILGKSIISPFYKREFFLTDKVSKLHLSLTEEAASLACNLAFERAKNGKGEVSFCMGSGIKGDELLFGKFEDSSLNFHGVQTDIQSANELVWDISDFAPSMNIILSSGSTADMLLSQFSAVRKNLDGYICMHTPNNRIYCRMPVPYEKFGNHKIASVLFASAEMIENELGMKSAAMWLRRAIGLSSIYCESTTDEYISNIISAIADPIRMRKTK